MQRLAQLVAFDSVELDLFEDAIAQRMPPAWSGLLRLGTEPSVTQPPKRSSFRVAEPFNSPASLIRGEVDLLWNWYLKQDLPFDNITGQTNEIVNRLYVRRSTGTIRDWLPACVSHLVPAPQTARQLAP